MRTIKREQRFAEKRRRRAQQLRAERQSLYRAALERASAASQTGESSSDGSSGGLQEGSLSGTGSSVHSSVDSQYHRHHRLWHSPAWTPGHGGANPAYLTSPLLRVRTAHDMRRDYMHKLEVMYRLKGPQR